jgi:serine/threonine protein kinase
MKGLPDRVLDHLREVIEAPDLSATRYSLEKEVGRGGMGVVYSAHDTVLDRRVALKVLSSVNTAEPRTLAQLEHPGIVPVHDSGLLPDGRAYYVMKLVQGARLDQFAAGHPALPELLRVMSRICEPVAFAHAHGIIHRDLKPENVMLGPFGEVLVLDWGVARVLGSAQHDSVAGTRGYMSPEQASGQTGALDVRSDVFSLGRIMEYLLASTDAPQPVRAIARKAAATDRELRYAGALDLSADIARFLDGQPVSAYRESWREQTLRWISHHKTLAALILTYVAIRALIFFFTRR